MVFAALIGRIIGAKLFIAENSGPLFSAPAWSSGGLIGGAIAVCAWAQWRGERDLQLATSSRRAWPPPTRSAASAASGRRRLRQGLGRPVGDGLSARTVPATATVHPTPIYEIIVMGGFTCCCGAGATAGGRAR
jgi:hypothetical protein